MSLPAAVRVLPLTLLLLLLVKPLHAFSPAPIPDPDSIDGLNPSAPPALAPSGRCYFPEDCASSEFCEQPSGSFGRLGACKTKSPIGADCEDAFNGCSDEAYCESTPPPGSEEQLCKAKGKAGGKCDANFESCLEGLVCRVEVVGVGENVCGVAGKEGDRCRNFDECADGFYCTVNDLSNPNGMCKKRVSAGNGCTGAFCCDDGSYEDFTKAPAGFEVLCVARKKVGESCVGAGGDNVCEKGSLCNGDELLKPNTESPPKCVKESELIREGGAECDVANDKCDSRRFMVCRKRGDKGVCIFENPQSQPCTPGAEFEVCLDDTLPDGSIVSNECLEVKDKGKPSGEFVCQKTDMVEPTKAPSPTPSTSPSPKPKVECKSDRDCKWRKRCEKGKCVRRKCNRWRTKRCERKCKRCDERCGRCKGGCRRRSFCLRGRCRRSKY